MDKSRRKFVVGTAAAGAAVMIGGNPFITKVYAGEKEKNMKEMKFFLDTHDRDQQTFPAKISPKEFEQFYAKYKEACYEEGVIPVRIHIGYDAGKAFCLTMAPDETAVERAHKRAGLPFDSISEVEFATPGDTFFNI